MSTSLPPNKRPPSPSPYQPSNKHPRTTSSPPASPSLHINYLARQFPHNLPLVSVDHSLPSILSLLQEYDGVLHRHESIASNLGACPLGPILVKRFERLFDAPPKVISEPGATHPDYASAPFPTPSPSPVSWLDVVEFARLHPEQFTLQPSTTATTVSPSSSGEHEHDHPRRRCCRIVIKQTTVEISEEDYVLINSGIPQRMIPPQPIDEDEEKELRALDLLEKNLRVVVGLADQVSARARQLNHRLRNRGSAIAARREKDPAAGRLSTSWRDDVAAYPLHVPPSTNALPPPPPPPPPRHSQQIHAEAANANARHADPHLDSILSATNFFSPSSSTSPPREAPAAQPPTAPPATATAANIPDSVTIINGMNVKGASPTTRAELMKKFLNTGTGSGGNPERAGIALQIDHVNGSGSAILDDEEASPHAIASAGLAASAHLHGPGNGGGAGGMGGMNGLEIERAGVSGSNSIGVGANTGTNAGPGNGKKPRPRPRPRAKSMKLSPAQAQTQQQYVYAPGNPGRPASPTLVGVPQTSPGTFPPQGHAHTHPHPHQRSNHHGSTSSKHSTSHHHGHHGHGHGHGHGHSHNRDDGGPFKLEMISRMEDLARGARVLPPCDRCRRLNIECLKNLTACMGCTKKHAKCSWKDVTVHELSVVWPRQRQGQGREKSRGEGKIGEGKRGSFGGGSVNGTSGNVRSMEKVAAVASTSPGPGPGPAASGRSASLPQFPPLQSLLQHSQHPAGQTTAQAQTQGQGQNLATRATGQGPAHPQTPDDLAQPPPHRPASAFAGTANTNTNTSTVSTSNATAAAASATQAHKARRPSISISTLMAQTQHQRDGSVANSAPYTSPLARPRSTESGAGAGAGVGGGARMAGNFAAVNTAAIAGPKRQSVSGMSAVSFGSQQQMPQPQAPPQQGQGQQQQQQQVFGRSPSSASFTLSEPGTTVSAPSAVNQSTGNAAGSNGLFLPPMPPNASSNTYAPEPRHPSTQVQMQLQRQDTYVAAAEYVNGQRERQRERDEDGRKESLDSGDTGSATWRQQLQEHEQEREQNSATLRPGPDVDGQTDRKESPSSSYPHPHLRQTYPPPTTTSSALTNNPAPAAGPTPDHDDILSKAIMDTVEQHIAARAAAAAAKAATARPSPPPSSSSRSRETTAATTATTASSAGTVTSVTSNGAGTGSGATNAKERMVQAANALGAGSGAGGCEDAAGEVGLEERGLQDATAA